jgi:hypothetical protein
MRFLVVAVVVAALAVTLSAQASPQAKVRVVDRTLACAASYIGGIYQIGTEARAGTGRRGASWQRPATTMVTTGSTGSSLELLDNTLAWAIAGTPTRNATVVPDDRAFGNATYPIRVWGTFATRNRCRVFRTRPPLSQRGLNGGAVDWFGQAFDCTATRQVTVRVRATFAVAASLSSRQGNYSTTAPLTEARVVVATSTGKRLAYAEVLSSGKARLFTNPASCFPD